VIVTKRGISTLAAQGMEFLKNLFILKGVKNL